MTATIGATGKIVQVTGPVVDVEFPTDRLPEIYNALKLTKRDGTELTLEVQQHLGNDWVRAVAMSSSDGLVRGMDVVDQGGPISVPVGPPSLGRIFNVVGDTIDGKGPVGTGGQIYPIHRPTPSFEDQTVNVEVFETGMKVIDLVAPFTKGG